MAPDASTDSISIDSIPELLKSNALTLQGLDNIISQLRSHLDSTAAREYPTELSNHWQILVQVSKAKFDRTKSIPDLNQLIISLQAAASAAKQPLTEATWLNNLSSALRDRFERTGSFQDLKCSYEVLETAVTRLIGDNAREDRRSLNLLVTCRKNQVWALKDLFHQTGCIENLNRALVLSAALVLHASPESRGKRLDSYYMLSHISLQRYIVLGSASDLERATTAINRTIQQASANHPDRGKWLGELSGVLQQRFQKELWLNDLTLAISTAEESLSLLPRDASRLLNLGQCLHMRYEQTGDISDLNQAVIHHEQALAIEDNISRRPTFLEMTALVLRRRFERMRSFADLRRSISLLASALALITESHHRRPFLLAALRAAFIFYGEENDSAEDCNHGIAKAMEALKSCPAHHPLNGQVMLEIADALQSRFDVGGEEADLDQAISFYKEAMEQTPGGLIVLLCLCNNLGNAFTKRYQKVSGLSSFHDLDSAIGYYEDAIECTPPNFMDYGGRICTLANVLSCRFEMAGNKEDLNRACLLYTLIVRSLASRPILQILAAVDASRLFAHYMENPSKLICDFLTAAIQLLPISISRLLNREDQQNLVIKLSVIEGGLAPMAALCAVESGADPFRALQILEQGRGVIGNLLLETRTDVTDLEEQHPKIAEEFKRARDSLNCVSTSKSSRMFMEVQSIHMSRRSEISGQFENLLKTIRALKGFENFALGPSMDELKHLAIPGPIVAFNVAISGGLAFLITVDGVKCLTFPSLMLSSVEEMVKLFRATLISTRNLRMVAKSNNKLRSVLKWLWEAAVGPVLDELGFTNTPEENSRWPHVWWVPGGVLSALPLHAAGDYSKGSANTTLDRVISSYTPTIKALAYSRRTAAQASEKNCQNILLAAMPDTPHQLKLPYAEAEVDELNRSLPSSIQARTLKMPDKADVITKIPNFEIVHLACHGESNSSDPSKSCLLLADWKTQGGLSVADITSLRLGRSHLIYLSICHAANNQAEKLREEEIHLSSAFQLAGFSHVVGTLWSVRDDFSAKVALKFYKEILHGDRLKIGNTAEGLHRAIRQLRNESRKRKGDEHEPAVWAPYIHSGA